MPSRALPPRPAPVPPPASRALLRARARAVAAAAVGISLAWPASRAAGQLVINGNYTNSATLSAGTGQPQLTITINNSTFSQTATGVLNASDGGLITLNATNVVGGLLTTSGTGVIRASNSGSNFLSGVALAGTLDLGTAVSTLRVQNGLTLGNGGTTSGTVQVNAGSAFVFQGTQTLGGTGTVVLGATAANNRVGLDGSNAVLTVGPNVTIRGENGVVGAGLYVGGGGRQIANQGLITADVAGGTISIEQATVANTGTLGAANGGTLRLTSAVTNGVGGQLAASANGVLLLDGARVTGGTITTATGGVFRASASASNFLDGVTLAGTADLAGGTRVLRVENGLTLQGGAAVAVDNGSAFVFQGSQTLGGTGTVALGGAGSNRIALDGSNATLTIGPNVTLRGENGSIGQGVYVGGGGRAIVNNGTIAADVAGGTVTIDQAPVTNNGTLRAANGGTLVLNSSVTGGATGVIEAGAGSVVLQNGVTVSGQITTAGAGAFRASASGSNFLSGVTLDGTLDLATAPGVERVTGGLTLQNGAAVNVNNGSAFVFQGTQTFGGTGTVVLGAAGNNRVGLDGSNAELTIGPNVTIRGAAGSIGQGVYVGGGGRTIVNNGVIAADVAGGTLTIDQAPLTNNGTLRAANGGTLVLNSSVAGGATGQIEAGAGSVVLQNGVTLSGRVATTGTGTLRASASGSNFLDGVTLAGRLDLATAAGVERVVGGLTLEGGATIDVDNGSVVAFQGTQTLGGTGTVTFGATGNNRLAIDGSNAQLTIGPNVTVRGTTGNIGQGVYVGGGGRALVNTGAIVSDGGGTITVSQVPLTNDGLLRAQTGTLALGTPLSGTGTLQADAGGTLTLSSGQPAAQGVLAITGAGATVNNGTQSLTLSRDYLNAAAGSGDAFNRRAGLTGTGQVLAGGAPVQAIVGPNVSNGTTAAATLTIGNVRVGANDFQYVVQNAGTGPAMRGAIQTGVNGGSITDARLSGSGVTAGLYGPTTTGGTTSPPYTVTFTAATAGALAPLTGQAVNLRSTYDNVGDQKLNIVVGAGAAAYRVANPVVAPTSVTLAARVGDAAPSQAIGVTNQSPDAFTEALDASFTGPTPAGFSTSGSVTGLAAGASSNALSVALNTGTAGTFGGSAAVGLVSSGAGTTGAADLALGTANVTLAGRVYTAAVGEVSPTTVDFGIVHVGDAAARTVSVRNAAAVTALNDVLRGGITGGNAAFAVSGTLGAGLAAGATDNTSLQVALNTSTSGQFTGSGLVSLVSSNPDLADLALGSQGVQFVGQVNNYADAGLAKTGGAGTFGGAGSSYTLDFGTRAFGSGPLSADLAVDNLATGFADLLGGSFTLVGGGFTFAGFDAFSGLGAGGRRGGLRVTFDAATAGMFSGTVTLNAFGTNASGYFGALGPVRLTLSGAVAANPDPSVVPEPGTWALLAAGLGAMGAAARRRAAPAA